MKKLSIFIVAGICLLSACTQSTDNNNEDMKNAQGSDTHMGSGNYQIQQADTTAPVQDTQTGPDTR